MKKILFILILLTILTSCKPIKENIEVNEKENEEVKEISEEEKEVEEVEENLFSPYFKDAENKLKELSLEEKIGQLFLVRLPSLEEVDDFIYLKPGGFILFGKDFKDKTKNQVTSEINGYQQKSSIPLIIAVDEEGGTVVRVSSNPLLSDTRFKSPQELYNIGGFNEIKKDTVNKSTLLLDLGINLNLSPVADVSLNEADFIYKRSFGKSVQETAEYVKIVVGGMKYSGISGTLKHFPGYGNNIDTHTGSAFDSRTYEHFVNNDFIPFKAGIEEGVESILISHNIVEAIDPKLPASLSKKTVNILRNELNFSGIIMTDDLSMGAIQELEEMSPVSLAVEAGNDMLIVTDFKSSYDDLLNAVKHGEISEDRINESVLRILQWKMYMGIL